jgi:hypothetical protein
MIVDSGLSHLTLYNILISADKYFSVKISESEKISLLN